MCPRSAHDLDRRKSAPNTDIDALALSTNGVSRAVASGICAEYLPGPGWARILFRGLRTYGHVSGTPSLTFADGFGGGSDQYPGRV